MRLLGLPIVTPDAVAARVAGDLGALAQMARRAPEQLDRLLALGEEITGIGARVLELGERIDQRAEAMLELGGQIEARADAILALGDRLDARAEGLLELGREMRGVGEQIDARGAEIVERATAVADTGAGLIGVIPTLERAMEMATPLEGAIDRFGRLVDRLPGGAARRRGEPVTPRTDQPTDPPEPLGDPAADPS